MAQVAEVDQRLMHGLIASQGVCVLHGLPHNVSILILHDDDLLRLCHARNHQATQLGQDTVVQVLTVWSLQQEQYQAMQFGQNAVVQIFTVWSLQQKHYQSTRFGQDAIV